MDSVRRELDRDLEADGVVDGTIADIDAASAAMAYGIAAYEGISFEAAFKDAALSRAFDQVTAQIESEDPYAIAGAEWDSALAQGWIGFKDTPSALALELIRTFPAKIETDSSLGWDRTTLAQESVATIRTLRDALAQEGLDTEAIATSVDERDGAVRVSAAADVLAVAREHLAGHGAARGASVPLTFVEVESVKINPEDSSARGGGHLNRAGVPYCTAGFTVTNLSTTTKRLSGAGHCWANLDGTVHTSSLQYVNHSADGGNTNVGRVSHYMGLHGDMAITTTGAFTPLQTFYNDVNSKVYAEAIGPRPNVGGRLCKYGRTTHYTCADVQERFASSGSIESLVRMDKHVSADGDSGGPWFNGTTAYGIHHGGSPLTGSSYFTPTFKLEELNYQVWHR